MGSSPGPATFFSARGRDPDARRSKEQTQCALPHMGQRGSRTGARRARDLGSPSPSPSVEPAPSPPLEHNAVRRSGNGEAPTGRNRTGRHPTAGEGALRHQSFLMGGLLQTPGGRSNAPWGLPQRLEPGSSPPVGGSPRRQSHLARERRRRRPKNASPHGRERFDERALLSCLSYSELLELTPPPVGSTFRVLSKFANFGDFEPATKAFYDPQNPAPKNLTLRNRQSTCVLPCRPRANVFLTGKTNSRVDKMDFALPHKAYQ